MDDYPRIPRWVHTSLHEGQVIPAHPLALLEDGSLDERHQRALTRYYHAAGAGGLAVGVHTTQFEIREAEHDLYEPVLELARDEAVAADEATGLRTILIAGILGRTEQAVREARIASEMGYHAGLLSLAALQDEGEDELLHHCRIVAHEIPLFGFYLQPAVGGRELRYSFWRRFAEIPNVVAIKIAPFNRYQTLDVVRAVAMSGRAREIALYTGNDDHIVLDLLTEYVFEVEGREVRLGMAGGLLGHWAFWTRQAVELLDVCKQHRGHAEIPRSLLTLAEETTDVNAAVFDVANAFRGCIPGIHHVLAEQGLMGSTRCLNPQETLSYGQVDEIERVSEAYPHLNDDAFVAEHIHEWLS